MEKKEDPKGPVAEDEMKHLVRVMSKWLHKGYFLPASAKMIGSMLFTSGHSDKREEDESSGDGVGVPIRKKEKMAAQLLVDVETEGSGFPIAFKVPIPNTGTFEATAARLATLFYQTTTTSSSSPSISYSPSEQVAGDTGNPGSFHYHYREKGGELRELFPHTDMTAFVWPDSGCKVLWMTRRPVFPVGIVLYYGDGDTLYYGDGDTLYYGDGDTTTVLPSVDGTFALINTRNTLASMWYKVDLIETLGKVLAQSSHIGDDVVCASALNADSSVLATVNRYGRVRYYCTFTLRQLASSQRRGEGKYTIVTNAKIDLSGHLVAADTLLLKDKAKVFWAQLASTGNHDRDNNDDPPPVVFRVVTKQPVAPTTELAHLDDTTVLVCMGGDVMMGYDIRNGRAMFRIKTWERLMNWDRMGRFTTYRILDSQVHIRFYKVLPSTHEKAVAGDTMVVSDPSRKPSKYFHNNNVVVVGKVQPIDVVQIDRGSCTGLLHLQDDRPVIPTINNTTNLSQQRYLLPGNRLLVYNNMIQALVVRRAMVRRKGFQFWDRAPL